MEVINCRKCGRLFNYIAGAQVCPMCKEASEKKFQEVKAYIQEHNRCSMAEVCEECDVESRQIQSWIRAERLQFSDDSPIKVTCEKCGTMIGSGRFCEKCKNQMSRNLGSVLAKPSERETKAPKPNPGDNKNRMRFL